MRLIDADALGIGKCNPDVFDDKGYAKGWNSAIEYLQNAPTVDAVPVVRCKDCANRLVFTDGSRLCFGGICSGATNDDFFCANGVARERSKRDD